VEHAKILELQKSDEFFWAKNMATSKMWTVRSRLLLSAIFRQKCRGEAIFHLTTNLT